MDEGEIIFSIIVFLLPSALAGVFVCILWFRTLTFRGPDKRDSDHIVTGIGFLSLDFVIALVHALGILFGQFRMHYLPLAGTVCCCLSFLMTAWGRGRQRVLLRVASIVWGLTWILFLL